MGDIVPYRPPQGRAEWTAYLGMVVFLASWAMMFGALFFAYGMVRARAAAWPPGDSPRLPLLLPGINTVVLGASSGAVHLALGSLGRGRARRSGAWLGVAVLLGAIFLALQVEVWADLFDAGLRPSGGPYPSVFYALTGFHALHVAVGLVALAWLCRNALVGRYSAARHLPVRLWSLYWHFVGGVWGAMFLSVYVI